MEWTVFLLGGLFAVAILTAGGLAFLGARAFAQARGWLTVTTVIVESPPREHGVL